MKAIDQFGMPLRSTTRRKVKARSDVMFKLRDPATGLFWGVSPATNPKFNSLGKQWGSRQAALHNWAEYNFFRAKATDINTHPNLELVTFKIAVTETGSSAANSPDMSVAVALEAAAPSQYSLNAFVKKLCKAGYPMTHVIECVGTDIIVPKHIKAHMQTHSLNSWAFSSLSLNGRTASVPTPSPPSEEVLIAVNKVADAIYLKMALQEFIVAIWDIDEIMKKHLPISPVRRYAKNRKSVS